MRAATTSKNRHNNVRSSAVAMGRLRVHGTRAFKRRVATQPLRNRRRRKVARLGWIPCRHVTCQKTAPVLKARYNSQRGVKINHLKLVME